jgi:hypothetical protein
MRLEGIGELKKCNDLIGNRAATPSLVTYCLGLIALRVNRIILPEEANSCLQGIFISD